MIWMMFWWVAVIGLLIALTGFFFSTVGRSSQSNESPKTILRRRYAAEKSTPATRQSIFWTKLLGLM